ncbi:MAG: cation:proton antiporter [Nitrospinales bacterium]
MEHIWITVFGFVGLLGLASLMLPLSHRLKIPHTVLLAAVGCILGIISMEADFGQLGIFGDFLSGLRGIEISSEAVLFIFLPGLIFGSALTIDVHRLFDDIVPILLLAVVGLLISTFVVGYTISYFANIPLLVCLLLGAIVSATDPVAVMAIFKDMQAPKRLTILVEGESLFNDATAIVMFTLLASMLTGGSKVGFVYGTISFLKVFFGGLVVGYACAWVTCFIIERVGNLPLVKITLTISLAYLSFILAERYLHFSGVMAVVASALTMATFGKSTFTTRNWESLSATWEQIEYWANSIIFVLVGMAMPKIISSVEGRNFSILVALIIVSFIARAGFIYGLLPILSLRNFTAKVSSGFKAIMFWGGLRGAVSLALALAVMENNSFMPEVRSFIGILVTGFVLFTLFINATTIGLLLKFFGMDKLSPVDVAIRNRATAISLDHICERINTATRDHMFDSGASRKVINHYNLRKENIKKSLKNLEGILVEDWVCVGLVDLCGQERKAYLQRFAGGFVSSAIVQRLLANIDDILDSSKGRGVEGYRIAYKRRLGFDWRFQLAQQLHRRFGYSSLLAKRLGDRFEILLAQKSIVKEVMLEGLPKAISLIGVLPGEKIMDVMQERIDAVETELTVLKLHYPEYASQLQERYLGRVATRLEESEYQELYNDSIISREVLGNLEVELETSSRKLLGRPSLDLDLKPEHLVKKVPCFSNLPPDRIKQIVRLLKSRLTIPGEIIVKKGDPADAMYFISSGAIQVDLENKQVHLGTGDFFGEIGLIKEALRMADVIAIGYCELLVLYAPDFFTFLKNNPELADIIDQVAGERLGKAGLE